MNIERFFVSCLILWSLSSASLASTYQYDVWEENYNVSALIGATKYDNLKFHFNDSASQSEEADLTLVPQLGGAWYTLPIGNHLQCGLESTFLLGFQADKLNYLRAGGGGLYVSVSTSMWMFDLAGGVYANLYPDPKKYVRLYAGGGPLIMYASYRVERKYEDNSGDEDEVEVASAFGIGGYARTGIEFRIHERGMLGIGARGSWTSIDFTDVGGRSELVGIAGFLTYTVGF